MALTVKQLNADASFLLSFEPVLPTSKGPLLPNPDPFTILLDPWLAGPSTIFHPRVSFTRLHSPACVTNLTELPEPDLVVISQHRSDHCNEPTLRQLPGRGSGSKTIILAEPSATRIIRSWKHFEPEQVRSLERWDKLRSRDTVTKIEIPPIMEGGTPGEITVAFITPRRDITGLHGAIGITYRPPGITPGGGGVTPKLDPIVTWTARPQSNDTMVPPATPKGPHSASLWSLGNEFSNKFSNTSPPGYRGTQAGFSRPHLTVAIPQNNKTVNGNGLSPASGTATNTLSGKTAAGSNSTTGGDSQPSTPISMVMPPPMPTSPPPAPPILCHLSHHTTPSPLRTIRSLSTIVSPALSPLSNSLTAVTSVPTRPPTAPPHSPHPPPHPPLPASDLQFPTGTSSTQPPAHNRPVSVIFSPHGTSATTLADFTNEHLAKQAAVPVTLLMHCFDRARNPWFLGGEISLGAQAGAAAAARLGARCWVSAHDGDKEVRGLATKILRTKRWDITEIEGAVAGWERGMGIGMGMTSGTGMGRKCWWPRVGRRARKVGDDDDDDGLLRSEKVGFLAESSENGGDGVDDDTTTITTTTTTDDDDDGCYVAKKRVRTRVMALGLGEEVVLTSEGVCDSGETTPTRNRSSLQLAGGSMSNCVESEKTGRLLELDVSCPAWEEFGRSRAY